jgi:hypothetical protein
VIRAITEAIPKLADAQGGQEMAMARQHAEVAFRAGSNDFIDLLTQQLLFRRNDL